MTLFERALDKAEEMCPLSEEEACVLISANQAFLPRLMRAARRRRDYVKGCVVSYSPKVFIPLTNLCRDRCGYCTFRKDPGDPGAKTMGIDEVLAVANDAARLGCKEALFSLGDRPEAVFHEARRDLQRLGFQRTMDYLVEACRRVVEETPLFPHANPGLMGTKDLERLKQTNVSVGVMLESMSERLLRTGGAHANAPDKKPRLRLQTLERAGHLKLPVTTGILVGIGETIEERVRSLFAIQRLHEKYGHVQEVIIQNFRAKPKTPMESHPDLTLEDLLKTIAVARLVLDGEMNLQAPPNLSMKSIRMLLRAGINDFGGISPLTPDFINPEAPWPNIQELVSACEAEGLCLRERLPVYPDFINKNKGFMVPWLADRAREWIDASGFVATPRSCLARLLRRSMTGTES
jgi:FO synthase